MTYTHRAWSRKLIIALLLLPLLFFLAAPVAHAEDVAGSRPEPTEEGSGSGDSSGLRIVPSCATEGNDVPQLDCVLLTLGNIAQLILALTGGLALLMFVYGGFLLLSSGGSSDKVTQGKNTLKAAVIGIIVVLLSGYLIRWGLSSLNVDTAGFVEGGGGTEESSGSGDSEAGE